ncbi:MAG: histidine kinase [Flavobacteriia bacterium]|nr:histidine kinase [Flavobacteriia bacterium]
MKKGGFIFLFLLFSGLSAQQPYFHLIDKSAGLPSNSVFDIFQDRLGFMWFATDRGLCRFDGSQFETFGGNFKTSISGTDIQQDRFGRIWYQNFDGFIFYLENNQLKLLEQGNTIGFYNFGITKNRLFYINEKGLNIIDIKTLKTLKVIPIDGFELRHSFSYDDNFYIFGNKLYEINEKGDVNPIEFDREELKNMTAPILNGYYGNLFIISKYSPKVFVYSKGKFSKYPLDLKMDFIQSFSINSKGIWYCMPNGVINHKLGFRKTNSYFPEKSISKVFEDRSGHFWISTLGEGLLFVENFDSKLYSIPTRPTTITEKGNEIYIGTDKDEIYSFDTSTRKIENIYRGSNNHMIIEIFFDHDDMYFSSSKFIQWNQKLIFERPMAIKELTRIDDKYAAVAASNSSGLLKLREDLESDWDPVFEKFYERNEISEVVGMSNTRSVAFNPKNNTVYFATHNNLLKLDKSGNISALKFEENSLLIRYLEYFEGTVYGLSHSGEIFKIGSDNKISRFDTEGIPSEEKPLKIKISEGRLYLFLTNSIYGIDLKTGRRAKVLSYTRNLDVTDLISKDGQLYFATRTGIIRKTGRTGDEGRPPKLFLRTVKVNDKPIDVVQLDVLKYTENNIEIDYLLLTDYPSTVNTISYKINDSEWQQLSVNSRILNLTSLAPGPYEIRIKAEIDNQFADEISFNFKIKEPFWKTFWFIGLILILLVSLFYLWFVKQLKKIEKRNLEKIEKMNLEKMVNQSKLKAVKSQMNPHFFYNALNTLQSYILLNDKKQALGYLSKFSGLTRTILEMTEKDEVSLEDEIKAIKLYLEIEKGRFGPEFSYEIEVAEGVDPAIVKIPSMLIQPYVENAVKHGLLHKDGPKLLRVLFSRTDDEKLKIEIDDNGIGRKRSDELNQIRAQKRKSFATEAQQNRIELLNRSGSRNFEIRIIDKTDEIKSVSLGTTVIIQMDLKQNYESDNH